VDVVVLLSVVLCPGHEGSRGWGVNEEQDDAAALDLSLHVSLWEGRGKKRDNIRTKVSCESSRAL